MYIDIHSPPFLLPPPPAAPCIYSVGHCGTARYSGSTEYSLEYPAGTAGGRRASVAHSRVLRGTPGYYRGTVRGHWRAQLQHGRGPRLRCCRAQARTCPAPRAATSARRAPCGSRPRRRAALPPPPRARPCRRLRLSWGPTLPSRGAATTPAPTMRSSTRTRSAPECPATSCCAPHSPPPVRHRAPRRGTCAFAPARVCATRTRVRPCVWCVGASALCGLRGAAGR
jgi:hypothetical protein